MRERYVVEVIHLVRRIAKVPVFAYSPQDARERALKAVDAKGFAWCDADDFVEAGNVSIPKKGP